MPLPRDVSGQAATLGLATTGLFQTGDYVVPEFSDTGHKTKNGSVVGDAEVATAMSKKMLEHALMEGATLLPDILTKKAKKGAKAKAGPPLPPTGTPMLRVDSFEPKASANAQVISALPLPHIEVVFLTQLGRIKVEVLAVLEAPTCLALVFASERDILYEPEPGTNLQLVIKAKAQAVMYPGFRLTWLDNTTQLMVFIKLDTKL